ncbi:MAG: thiamine ABC transporter substrate-binding protein, partial [Clostridia bacterium]|nr:thiamine ABC transporter substrate-binding protein [Clostridia bacterium]
DSREVLEAALDDFDGTILTVSHDRYFINKVANRVIEITPEGVREYIGNYDDYLEKKRLEEAGDAAAESLGLTRTQLDKEKRLKRLQKESAKALRQKLQQAEAEIASTEAEIERLETSMGTPEVYANPEESARVARAHREAQERLDALYEDWEALSEAVAGLDGQ